MKTSPNDITISINLDDEGKKCLQGNKAREKYTNPDDKEEKTIIINSKEDDDFNFAIKDSAQEVTEDGMVKRSVWDNKVDYIMSLLGYSVGFSNIWRFPYNCYINGGGAFLVPYFFTLFLVGIPMFLLEMSMGQFASAGGITIFNVSPVLEGCGFAGLLSSTVGFSYFSVLASYPLLFLYHSLSSELPWKSCDNSWNTERCYKVSSFNASDVGNSTQWVSSANEFFNRRILNISDEIGENGDFVMDVFYTNIFVWVTVFFCIFKGIKYTGKIAWFTATFPFVMLVILLIRSAMLPGASTGIYYYLYPDLQKLGDLHMWAAAATQVLYSLGPGWTTCVTLGSFNKFRNNCLLDCILLPLLNSTCSLLAGFVVFSMLGFMAHERGTTVDEVVAAGPDLMYITYPEALSLMPLAPLWSALFFVTLYFVGLDSFFVSVEACISNLLDRLPSLRRWRIRITVAVLSCMFFISLPFTMQGGMYLLQLMDWYLSSLFVMLVCLCEVCMFSYVYGVGNVIRDIQMMTRRRLSHFWFVCLLVITPVVVTLLLVNQVASFGPATYREEVFPEWAQTVGWVIAIVPVLIIPITSIIKLWRYKGSIKERIINGFTPVSSWGPLGAENRAEWEEHCRSNPLRHKFLPPDFSISSNDDQRFTNIHDTPL